MLLTDSHDGGTSMQIIGRTASKGLTTPALTNVLEQDHMLWWESPGQSRERALLAAAHLGAEAAAVASVIREGAR